MSNTNESLLKQGKKNILWIHVTPNSPELQNLNNRHYLEKVDYIVFVSHWQYEKFRYFFKIPEYKSLVIQNATEKTSFYKRQEKIKLIYTSTPWRGLHILLDAFQHIKRDDVELDVYSSADIYGKEFVRQQGHLYSEVIDRAKNLKNVNYFGYATNSEIKNAL